MSTAMKAGAAAAVVEIGQELLPLDGYSAVHDPLHVRALLLESGEKLAVVSVEITSLFTEAYEQFMAAICEITGLSRENVWLTLTHSFGGPHIWPAPKPGEPAHPGPRRSPEESARNAKLKDAYLAALRTAVTAARDGMTGAAVGWGRGQCLVNTCRNMLTPEGWWLGADDEGPCSHELTVLRIDRADGGPLAMLFNYPVRSCVTSQVKCADGTYHISADLMGCTAAQLEAEFGGGFTALPLAGAAGDQIPRMIGFTERLDRNGVRRTVELGEAAFPVMEAQAQMLADSTLRIYRGIETLSAPALQLRAKTVRCGLRRKEGGFPEKPSRTLEIVPEGGSDQTVYLMKLGGFCAVGVQPELCGAAAAAIAAADPETVTAVGICVNGCDKCMPEREAYENVKYQAMHSPFMPGSAELIYETAAELMKGMEQK